MLLRRSLRTQLALAVLFIVLGAGNIIFGTFKAREYRHALFQATQVVMPAGQASLEDKSLPQSLVSEPMSETPNSYPAQIRARYDFYLFVTVGGKWMLAVAGFFLLLLLVGLGDREDEGPRE